MTHIVVTATIVLYAASFGLYTWNLYAPKRAVGRLASLCLAAGLVLHYLSLMERSRLLHTVPYEDLHGSLSLFAWLLVVTYLGLEAFHRQRSVGPFVLPFVLVLFLLAHTAPAIPANPPPARGPLFALHVTLNILAYSAFALSFVLSVIYLIQNHVLRDRRPGPVFWRFPALEVLERMSRSSVVVGLGSLAVGIVMGLIWANRIWGRYWNWDPKEVVTVLIVFFYAGYLWLARTTAWRGARASLVCVFNFLFVIFSYSVVNLYFSRFHRYF